ncbi:hypothetical protein [Candidatus Chromulinivorax destructor]|uniref:Uncharacterized protein n=1 Tax=Candidatus Chromulinivorax destructor TaxID=2066483 RepID=A0A345ZCX3_9BACT|nr:hypothetical protein [Candidatus Chromulinivorax destructor]AXK61140.1 hypothetical protein C0J27_05415 [Candidatus Chromulinivorax destructor]
MKNITKFMMISLMMTVGSLSAFGGNRMGVDPDTYRPGKETQNYFIFTSDHLDQSALNQAQVDATKVYGKYYPLLQQLSLKNINDNTFVCKFENVSVQLDQKNNVAPEETSLIATFTLPKAAAFQSPTFSVYGKLVQ